MKSDFASKLADKVSTMGYISVSDFAKKYDIPERTVRNYCAVGKIDGALLTGKTWNIPEDCTLPSSKKSQSAISPLLRVCLKSQEN